MKKKKIIVFVLLAAAFIVVLLFSVFNFYYDKLNYVKAVYHTSNIQKLNIDNKETQKKLDEKIEMLNQNRTPIPFNDNVFNIILIGSDTRDEENDSGRSDSMIIVSLNKETKKIYLTSMMRDMYIKIQEHGNNRLNTAYSYGGPGLLMDTIEENFKIKIDRYVQVDFNAFIDVINMIGGVDGIQIGEGDIVHINNYIRGVNEAKGIGTETGLLYDNGNPDNEYSLTGEQALAFSRIRYSGYGDEQNDFGRTARQRAVLTVAFNKAKGMDIFQLSKIMTEVLPKINTDITRGEAVSLILDLPEYAGYEIETLRVPIDGSYEDMKVRGMSVLGIDFEDNINYLQENIYGIQSETEEGRKIEE